jgi:hypothetical protein
MASTESVAREILNLADEATHVADIPLDRANVPEDSASAARMDELASRTFTVVTSPPGGELAF